MCEGMEAGMREKDMQFSISDQHFKTLSDKRKSLDFPDENNHEGWLVRKE